MPDYPRGLRRLRSRRMQEDATVNETGATWTLSKTIDVDGLEVLAQRITYVGEFGFELYVAPDAAVHVWDTLVDALHPEPVGYQVLDSLRIEKGYRAFGTDLTARDTPWDAGLGFCVDLDNGDFNGRAALMAARERGSDRKLRTLVVGDPDYLTLYGGEAVHAGGRVVGRLTSAAYGFTVRRNVAYAYLPTELGVGAGVEVEMFGEMVPAELAPDVLYDPERAKVAV